MRMIRPLKLWCLDLAGSFPCIRCHDFQQSNSFCAACEGSTQRCGGQKTLMSQLIISYAQIFKYNIQTWHIRYEIISSSVAIFCARHQKLLDGKSDLRHYWSYSYKAQVLQGRGAYYFGFNMEIYMWLASSLDEIRSGKTVELLYCIEERLSIRLLHAVVGYYVNFWKPHWKFLFPKFSLRTRSIASGQYWKG